jgi:hypothetical protein
MNMRKQMKKMIKSLKDDKRFLEKVISIRINNLNFYEHFNYLDEKQKTIDYLDTTWEQYDKIIRVLKELKRDLKGTK